MLLLFSSISLKKLIITLSKKWSKKLLSKNSCSSCSPVKKTCRKITVEGIRSKEKAVPEIRPHIGQKRRLRLLVIPLRHSQRRRLIHSHSRLRRSIRRRFRLKELPEQLARITPGSNFGQNPRTLLIGTYRPEERRIGASVVFGRAWRRSRLKYMIVCLFHKQKFLSYAAKLQPLPNLRFHSFPRAGKSLCHHRANQVPEELVLQ